MAQIESIYETDLSTENRLVTGSLGLVDAYRIDKQEGLSIAQGTISCNLGYTIIEKIF